MIVAVVAAIAITQREAKREQAAKEAEAAAAAKKDILVVGAGITGLLAALFCRAQGFTVTVIDAKDPEEFDDYAGGIVWLPPSALRVLERVHEKMPVELRKAACKAEVCVFYGAAVCISNTTAEYSRRSNTAATSLESLLHRPASAAASPLPPPTSMRCCWDSRPQCSGSIQRLLSTAMRPRTSTGRFRMAARTHSRTPVKSSTPT